VGSLGDNLKATLKVKTYDTELKSKAVLHKPL